jgi:hypothetical protein
MLRAEDLESERKGDGDAEMVAFFSDLVHVAEVALLSTPSS